MKFAQTNPAILILLAFSLTPLVEIANQEIAQAYADYKGNCHNFIEYKLTSQHLRRRFSIKPTQQLLSRLTASSKQSDKQRVIQDDLQIMLAGRAWIKEKTQEYPFRIVLQLRNEYELTIQSTEFGGTDKPEPIFPFFNFELQEREGKRFIASTNDSKPSTSKIHYYLEDNRLIIKSGSMTVQYKGGQKKVDLRGEYSPWFPAV